ncbi:DUF6913 domain-containing protein [Saccharicrinis sp. FJH2]|uniref:DUF6913 domain-containing protein n=1 Tax=Saccharicrinis sp. FJH65 TaxID=3344659 RepID=UPI0035F3E89A
MIQAIKTYLKNKALKDVCAQHKSQRQYRSLSDISRILIIFDGTDISKYGRINNIIKSLQGDGKTVTCLAFFDKKELDDICLTQNNIQFISRSEFDWKGLPNSDFTDEFLKFRYNLCLNLNLLKSDFVDVLCQIADAELKAGKNFGKGTVADLVIDVTDDKDETFLAEQIKYYLRSVKSTV